MSFIKIMIHAVWGTKSREPFLSNKIRPLVIEHIKQNARTKGIFIDRINGHTDHLHCLLALNADMSISKAMQLIKGESAFWINKQSLIPSKFEWADEYFAASVSESMLNKVRAYIDRQEDHHKLRPLGGRSRTAEEQSRVAEKKQIEGVVQQISQGHLLTPPFRAEEWNSGGAEQSGGEVDQQSTRASQG